MREFVELCATVVEVAGVAVIAGGLVLATLRLARAPAAGATRYAGYRRDLARAILLGLELLVAADITRTVAFAPTMASVLALAVIVVIRTFLSWSLTLELEGRWPWQRPLHTPIP
jgi:uncharacterized membrane protein